MTLKQLVAERIGQHGSVRKAARALRIDPGYLYRLATGEKSNPSSTVLRKLRVLRTVKVTYEDVP